MEKSSYRNEKLYETFFPHENAILLLDNKHSTYRNLAVQFYAQFIMCSFKAVSSFMHYAFTYYFENIKSHLCFSKSVSKLMDIFEVKTSFTMAKSQMKKFLKLQR